MRPPKLYRRKRNIAVVGMYRSGKTVFLTSFINHIQNHRPYDLKLDDGRVQITFDEELDPSDGLDRFPYEECRCENNSMWPRKTKTSYEYRCSFFRNDWRWTKGELSLIDIPGERLADIPMARQSYPKWSDWLLDRVFQDQQYREHSKRFTELCASEDAPTPAALIDTYRELLANLYRSYRPVISPSTFLLTDNGRFTGIEVVKSDLSQCFAGVDEQSQFAPLPRTLREKAPVLCADFERHYLAYRKKIASPLVNRLSACNELAVLIDVTTLLAANTGMYNGNRKLLEVLMEILSPGKGLFGVTLNLFKDQVLAGHWRKSGLSRIAVIATKADKVQDAHRGNLTLLLKDMAEGIINRFVQKRLQLDCEYFACAAIKSTKDRPDGALEARLQGSPDQWTTYLPSALPSRWPGSWKQGDFNFPDVNPTFPENNAHPPDHLGMENILGFLL